MTTSSPKTAETMAGTEDTQVLLRKIGQFPSPVLPVGLLRELQSRGDTIHDALVTFLDKAINAVRDGLPNKSSGSFFALALLVPLATDADRPLIESLMKLPRDAVDAVAGDLFHEAVPALVSNIFTEQNGADLIAWIERLADQFAPLNIELDLLFRALPIAVAKGQLDRASAIDVLVNQLKKRANERDDVLSGSIVCGLMDLSARNSEAVDAVVRECFEREQIDLNFVNLEDWTEIDSRSNFNRSRESWSDPAAELTTWCFEFISDDLDPVNATYYFNEFGGMFRFDDAPLAPMVDELRKSTDEQFPQVAVKKISSRFGSAYQPLIDLIRDELARYQSDSESWSGNGAYLGLVLTVAGQMPLPNDLLEEILRMPEKNREQLFGDQFGLIVQLVARSPQRNHDFLEEWIWDTGRSNADRREMVNAYTSAFHNGLMDPEPAVNALAAGLRRALDEEPKLIAPFAEELASLSPSEHSLLLEEAFIRDDVEWFSTLGDLRRMVQDADFAKLQFRERTRSYHDVNKIISAGVMLEQELLNEKPRFIQPLTQVYEPLPEGSSTTTIRNDDARAPRNAPCPCGSGKKYKKCCLNKRVS